MPLRVNTEVSTATSVGVPAVDAPAGAGVLALGVLAHDHDVDVLGLTPRERALHARQQPRRAEVHVLVEHLAQGQDEPPHVTCVRAPRVAHRAEKIASNAASCSGPSAGIIAPSAR